MINNNITRVYCSPIRITGGNAAATAAESSDTRNDQTIENSSQHGPPPRPVNMASADITNAAAGVRTTSPSRDDDHR